MQETLITSVSQRGETYIYMHSVPRYKQFVPLLAHDSSPLCTSFNPRCFLLARRVARHPVALLGVAQSSTGARNCMFALDECPLFNGGNCAKGTNVPFFRLFFTRMKCSNAASVCHAFKKKSKTLHRACAWAPSAKTRTRILFDLGRWQSSKGRLQNANCFSWKR